MKLATLFTAISLVATSGCASLSTESISKKLFQRERSADPTDVVVDILALWQPGEGRDANGLPTRGFAGQVLFFAAGSRSPVPVTGDVTVVVFDDQGTVHEQKKPLHEFHFRDGSWQNFQLETNLGPAYQVFIPYKRPGDHQAKCFLRVSYTSPDGQTVLSEQGVVVLNGRDQTPVEMAERTIPARRDASRSGLRTENIDLGRQTSNRFRDRTVGRDRVADHRQLSGPSGNEAPIMSRSPSTSSRERPYGHGAEPNGIAHALFEGRSNLNPPAVRSAGIEQTSFTLKPARQTESPAPRGEKRVNSSEPTRSSRVYTIPLDD